MRNLAERHADKGLVVIVVNAANATSQPETLPVVRQWATELRLGSSRSFGIALDGRLAAAGFGVTSQHTYFLIDRQGRVALRGSGWNEEAEKAITAKVDVLSGNLPPDFGWRRDIAASYTRAEEAYGAGRLPEALGLIKQLLPPRSLNVTADYKQLSTPQLERAARNAVARSVQEWKRQLGNVVEIVLAEIGSEVEIPGEKKETKPADSKKDDKTTKPNVLITFQRSVLDPMDDSGLRTTCSVIRVLNEREMGANMRAGTGDSPFYVTARIALGHGNEAHRLQALVNLAGAAIARGLGLDARDDDGSITRGGSVDGANARLTIAPSREDMLALGNLIATMNLRAGEIYLQQKKYDEAREALQLVASLQLGATSEKARNYLKEMPPATGGSNR